MNKKKLVKPIGILIVVLVLISALSRPSKAPPKKNLSHSSSQILPAKTSSTTKNEDTSLDTKISTGEKTKEPEENSSPILPEDILPENTSSTTLENNSSEDAEKQTDTIIEPEETTEPAVDLNEKTLPIEENQTEAVVEIETETKEVENSDSLNAFLTNSPPPPDEKEEEEEEEEKEEETDPPALIFVLGDAEVSIVATGEPLEGTITYGEPESGETGGIFTFNSPEKSPSTFTFKEPEKVGIAKIPVTFTPDLGYPVTSIYTIEVVPVSTLHFEPESTVLFTLGDPFLTVHVSGNEVSGELSYGEVDLGGTDAVVKYGKSKEHQGSFTFGNAKQPGIVTVSVTFTPKKGNPVTALYQIRVIPRATLNFRKVNNE